ncbi:MAG: rhodanese-like domain-containing protein [Flavobacteriales bacterium]|nr:rhodanese-like domain-containing protein [Flavobacteriales bacterium]
MKEITPLQLHQWRESAQPHQLIDIREEHEVLACSIGGEHIPMAEVLNHKDKIRTDVDVVFHCRSGKRSAAMVYTLEKKWRLKNLYSLKGGITAWAEEVDKTLAKC